MIKATRYLLLLAIFTCLSIQVLAQTTGSISGEVRDEKQAVIPNAAVTVRTVTTNQTRTVQTNQDGRFRFTGLSVGDYEVAVEASGFAKHVQSGITLAVDQSAVVDVTMKPGGGAGGGEYCRERLGIEYNQC